MNIDSVFDFARNLDPGVKMEDIVLVTGCHRTRSWANTAFTGVQEDAGVSLGVEVAGPLCSNVNWRVSGLIEGAVIRHCPNGEVRHGHTQIQYGTEKIPPQALPEDQCIFIRGFRVKRTSFKILQQIKAAAEHGDDSDDSDDSDSDNSDGWHRPEKEVVPIPSETEVRTHFIEFPNSIHSAFQAPGSSAYTIRIYHTGAPVDLCHGFVDVT